MSEPGSRPIAPSSKLALYLAAVIGAYVVADPWPAIGFAGVAIAVALIAIHRSGRAVPRARWRASLVFITWVFVMRAALDIVGGVGAGSAEAWLVAGRQAARVAVLAIGVIALLAVTTARDIVDELEHSRLPRSARLLVMMLVQYPRVLRDRYEQIVEAQVARGAERPRSIVQRVRHGGALLLPVMQSELNAIGERAGLIHLRGLDVDLGPSKGSHVRPTRDSAMLGVAALILTAAILIRLTTT